MRLRGARLHAGNFFHRRKYRARSPRAFVSVPHIANTPCCAATSGARRDTPQSTIRKPPPTSACDAGVTIGKPPAFVGVHFPAYPAITPGHPTNVLHQQYQHHGCTCRISIRAGTAIVGGGVGMGRKFSGCLDKSRAVYGIQQASHPPTSLALVTMLNGDVSPMAADGTIEGELPDIFQGGVF